MEMVGDGRVTLPIARAIRKSYEDCLSMHDMLSAYAVLGKPKIVVENGVRITKYPPAYARGVWPDRNVRGKS